MGDYYEGDADGYVSDLDRLGDQEVFEDMCAERAEAYEGWEDRYLDDYYEDRYEYHGEDRELIQRARDQERGGEDG